ncbi:zinc-binding dehydrogenase [Streptomyces avermitilis]
MLVAWAAPSAAQGGVGPRFQASGVPVALGARVATTVSTRDVGFFTTLGADTVIDYRTQRFEDHVRDVDVVIDLVGGGTQHAPRTCYAPAASGGHRRPTGSGAGRGARRAEHGARSARSLLRRGARPRPTGEGSQLIDSGRLKPMVDRVVPPPRAREAYEALEEEHPRGKVVIPVAPHWPTPVGEAALQAGRTVASDTWPGACPDRPRRRANSFSSAQLGQQPHRGHANGTRAIAVCAAPRRSKPSLTGRPCAKPRGGAVRLTGHAVSVPGESRRGGRFLTPRRCPPCRIRQRRAGL